jgi:hypothetical protein
MSKKYTCKQTKEEIINIIVSEFEKVNADLDSMYTDRNLGRYVAMFDLLQKVEIYESEE